MAIDDNSKDMLRIASQIVPLAVRFLRWAEREVDTSPETSTLTWRQLEALRIIVTLDAPPLGYVARELDVTPAVVTGLMDRLERLGFIRRVTDQVDSRVSRATITIAGSTAMAEVENVLCRQLGKPMLRMTTDELATLACALELLSSADAPRCPDCGARLQPEDSFCADCGNALRASARAYRRGVDELQTNGRDEISDLLRDISGSH